MRENKLKIGLGIAMFLFLVAFAAYVLIHPRTYPSEATALVAIKSVLTNAGYAQTGEKFYGAQLSDEPIDLRIKNSFAGGNTSSRLGRAIAGSHSNSRVYDSPNAKLEVRTDVSAGKVYAISMVGDKLPADCREELVRRCESLGLKITFRKPQSDPHSGAPASEQKM